MNRTKASTMKRAATCLAGLFVCANAAIAGSGVAKPPVSIFGESEEIRARRISWWQESRFGLFIHFGLYSMLARHEKVLRNEAIPLEVYDSRYRPRFNPDLYDAREWAKCAKKAGMKYAVLTTKHHEGFCLWDTKTTDNKATNTEFGRDVVREFVDAFRAEGLRVGFYYSIIDWHHPDYTVDKTHPLFAGIEGDKKDELEKLNRGRDMNRYRRYMFDQVTELLSSYGKIDIVWFDFTPKGEFGKTWQDWDAVELVRLARRLQPEIIIDSRLDLMDTDDGWDFVTPEQFMVQSWPTVRGRRVPWETCQTFSGSWGYYRDEETWKSVPQLVELLVHSVSYGGNMILNVGPTGRGEFDARAKERLDGIAHWMHWNARSVYGCGSAPDGFVAPSGTLLTYNEKTRRLYIHLFDYPVGFLPLAFLDRIEYAQFLHDGSEVLIRPAASHHSHAGEQKDELGGLLLPVKKPMVDCPVIECWLKRQ